MTDPIATAKAALRAEALARRAALADPEAAGARLADIVLAGMPPPEGAIVAGFWPIGTEIDLRPLLHALHARGHTLCLPETRGRGAPLIFRRWQPGDPLASGRFGTSHPIGEPIVPTFFLVPLLAFDRHGGRIGYGAGFYDRSIAENPTATRLGCAYHFQQVDEVPVTPHDRPLHAIATDQALLHVQP